jgi:hypothetical protein
MMKLLIATNNGLAVAGQAENEWRVEEQTLPGRRVTSVIAREGVILAGSRDGVVRSEDNGRTWSDASNGLSVRYVRWLAFHPDISDLEFAGTEPAAIFVSRNGGESWRECPEVTALRQQFDWFLPYSPEAGCVRGFAFQGQRGYAAVEVGGVLRSDDGGNYWALAAGSSGQPDTGRPPEHRVHSDVHSILTQPVAPERVYAPTGGGFYISDDGGQTWHSRYDCYCRAAWVNPDDANHIILGPADGVDRNGRIEASFDGGLNWQMASPGLDTPWRRHMVERFSQAGAELIAVLSNGQALITPLSTLAWRPLLAELRDINAISLLHR